MPSVSCFQVYWLCIELIKVNLNCCVLKQALADGEIEASHSRWQFILYGDIFFPRQNMTCEQSNNNLWPHTIYLVMFLPAIHRFSHVLKLEYGTLTYKWRSFRIKPSSNKFTQCWLPIAYTLQVNLSVFCRPEFLNVLKQPLLREQATAAVAEFMEEKPSCHRGETKDSYSSFKLRER